MDIKALCIESHDRARRKGFYDPPPSFESRLVLIHSEVTEALECFRDNLMVTLIGNDNKPVGFPSEIADVMIRLFDSSLYYGVDLDQAIELVMRGAREPFESIEQGLYVLHTTITAIGIFKNEMAWGALAVRTLDFAKWLEIDIEREIRIKSDYNENRPPGHGRTRL